jgi:hypothetical protein
LNRKSNNVRLRPEWIETTRPRFQVGQPNVQPFRMDLQAVRLQQRSILSKMEAEPDRTPAHWLQVLRDWPDASAREKLEIAEQINSTLTAPAPSFERFISSLEYLKSRNSPDAYLVRLARNLREAAEHLDQLSEWFPANATTPPPTLSAKTASTEESQRAQQRQQVLNALREEAKRRRQQMLRELDTPPEATEAPPSNDKPDKQDQKLLVDV